MESGDERASERRTFLRILHSNLTCGLIKRRRVTRHAEHGQTGKRGCVDHDGAGTDGRTRTDADGHRGSEGEKEKLREGEEVSGLFI